VPLTTLSYNEVKAAAKDIAKPKKPDQEDDVARNEALDAARLNVTTTTSEAGGYEENGGIDDVESGGPKDAVISPPFYPMPILLPLVGLSRLWGVNRKKIDVNLAALTNKDLAILKAHYEFLINVLVPDVEKILALQGKL